MKDGTILGERRYILKENELTCEKENASSTIKWSAIKSIEVGSKAIYLFVDRNQAFIIPRRIFVEVQSQNQFIETVTNKIKWANSNG